jgi:replicative DNA helicase
MSIDQNAERAVIGILIREPTAFSEVMGTGLSPEAFTDSICATIFGQMALFDARNEPWGLETIAALVDPSDLIKVVELQEQAPLTQNAGYFAREVVGAAWRRTAAGKLNELLRAVVRHPAYEADDQLKASVHSVFNDLTTDPLGGAMATPSLPTTVLKLADEYEDMKKHSDSGKLPGFPTGFPTLDRVMGGFRRRGLYLIAARPGQGKTALAACMALSAADCGAKVVFFTIEMADTQILIRMIARRALVSAAGVMDGKLSDEQEGRMFTAMEVWGRDGIAINDRAGRTIETFEMECRRLKRLGQLDMAVIDYVQLMKVTGKNFLNRQNEVSDISGRLKQLALALDTPIVALAQINREATKKDDKTPTVAQIRDSGALEQDADGILLIHRPGEYGDTGDDVLILAKNRYGSPGTLSINVDMSVNKITEAE